MRRVAALVAGILAIAACGAGDAEAFCAAAEELRVANADMLALVVEEGDPPLDEVRDRTAQVAVLSRRLAQAAPDEAVQRDYELIAVYQEQGAEQFAALTSPDQATPGVLDEATTQAFERTEAYVLEECGIALWEQV